MHKTILLVTLIAYSFIVSQSFMYILALKNTQLELDSKSYTEVRHLIDVNMNKLFRVVTYITLVASLALVVVNIKQPTSLMFITASIAFVALVIDAVLAVKGNIPINAVIMSWSPDNVPSNWREVREQWFSVFQYRQAANITGFLSLLVGTVFSK